MTEPTIHPTADVAENSKIGSNTKIWHQSQIREDSVIGEDCIIGKGVYIDLNVRIGDRCKVQNGVSIYRGVQLEDGVFCGPHCVFTNDLRPRAVDPDGTLKSDDDWTVYNTLVRQSASIGANAVIICGIEIGRWAMIGAGAVVTRSVPDHGLVYGNPARLRGFVCKCGESLSHATYEGEQVVLECPECGEQVTLPSSIFEQAEIEE